MSRHEYNNDLWISLFVNARLFPTSLSDLRVVRVQCDTLNTLYAHNDVITACTYMVASNQIFRLVPKRRSREEKKENRDIITLFRCRFENQTRSITRQTRQRAHETYACSPRSRSISAAVFFFFFQNESTEPVKFGIVC